MGGGGSCQVVGRRGRRGRGAHGRGRSQTGKAVRACIAADMTRGVSGAGRMLRRGRGTRPVVDTTEAGKQRAVVLLKVLVLRANLGKQEGPVMAHGGARAGGRRETGVGGVGRGLDGRDDRVDGGGVGGRADVAAGKAWDIQERRVKGGEEGSVVAVNGQVGLTWRSAGGRKGEVEGDGTLWTAGDESVRVGL